MPEGLVPIHATAPPASPADVTQSAAWNYPETHFLDRPLAAIRRYKWIIGAVVILATAAGFVGSKMVTPQYEVRATVWIESASSQTNRVGPISSGNLLSTSTAWIELFRSYRIVDEVVRQLALYLEPEIAADRPLFRGFTLANRFVPGHYELNIDRSAKKWALKNPLGVEVDRGIASDSIGRRIGFKWLASPAAFEGIGVRKVGFMVSPPRDVTLKLLDRLSNRLAQGSNFLWLSYQDPNPELAARTLNAWLTEYLRVAGELKKHNMVEFSSILEGQLQFAERATQDAENAYETFRVQTITLPADGGPVAAGVEATRDPALRSFFDQKIAYDNLRQDREALERSLANASAGNTPYEGLLLIPSVAQSPGAQALRAAFASQYEIEASLRAERQHFTDEFPTVKELKAKLDVVQTQTIPLLATQLLGQLRERELDYERRIRGASKELEKIPPRTIEEMRLKRAVTVAEGLYTNLKNRYAEAKLAEASASPDVSVLDTAVVPLQPTKNTARMIILAAAIGGLAAAIGLALLLDALDGKFRYASQATSDLGLVIAGAVPRIPKGGISASSPEQIVQFVESFRTLRMHVMHSAPGAPMRLAVTSAAPSDGKSLVSANLAISFSEAGFRTVLVDGDTRRGALHRMFGLSGVDGLTEYLAGAIDEVQAVRATTHANLSIVSCGRRHPRSPELLASPRLRALVENLSRRFDIVIFDTPPLAAGIDGYAISAAAGNVLMVLRMGQTERRLAATKLAVLDRLPVEVLGAVLNGAHLTGDFQYYAYSAGYSIGHDDRPGELAATATE